MKAAAALILLFGAAIAQAQEPNVGPLIDQIISNQATQPEKKSVFIQLKELLGSAPNSDFKYTLVKLISRDQVYPFPEDIGGPIGVKAVEMLKTVYKKSVKPKNVLGFLDICVGFMKNLEVSDHSQWLFFKEAADRMSETERLDDLKSLIVDEDWELEQEVLIALGIIEKPVNRNTNDSSTVKSTSNEDSYVTDLNQYWEKNAILRDGVLIDLIEYSVKNNRSTTFSDACNLHSNRAFPFHVDSILKRYPNFNGLERYVLGLAPNLNTSVYSLVETFNNYSLAEKNDFLDRLGRTGPVFHFFEKLRILDNPLPDLKNLSECDKGNVFLEPSMKKVWKIWMTMSTEKKELARRIMSKEISDVECLRIWNMIDQPGMEEVSYVVDHIDTYMIDGKSCFTRNETMKPGYVNTTFPPHPEEYTRKLWKNEPSSGINIVNLLKFVEQHEDVISEAYELAKRSTTSHLFSRLDSLYNNHPDFIGIIDILIELPNLDFDAALWSAETFFNMSSSEKEIILNRYTTNNEVLDFWRGIWFVKSVTKSLRLLKLYNKYDTAEFMRSVFRAWAGFNKNEKKMARLVLVTKTTSREKCKAVLNDPQLKKVVQLAAVFHFIRIDNSCFRKYGW